MLQNPIPFTVHQFKELEDILLKLTEHYKPENIICFGSHHYDTIKVSCFADNISLCNYHYFLLMVTATKTRIEHEVQDFVNKFTANGTITIIVHGIETIQDAINNGSRFFASVVRNGVQLYSASGFNLCLSYPDISNQETLSKAERHFSHRFGMASGFLEAAKNCLDNGYLANCAFLLHQAIEQSCIAMIRVHMAYRSDIHSLHRLMNLCSCFSGEPAAIFFRGTSEDTRLFNLLRDSYSGARYLDNYSISTEDAEMLLKRSAEFLQITKRLCTQLIAEFRTASIEHPFDYSPALPACA